MVVPKALRRSAVVLVAGVAVEGSAVDGAVVPIMQTRPRGVAAVVPCVARSVMHEHERSYDTSEFDQGTDTLGRDFGGSAAMAGGATALLRDSSR